MNYQWITIVPFLFSLATNGGAIKCYHCKHEEIADCKGLKIPTVLKMDCTSAISTCVKVTLNGQVVGRACGPTNSSAAECLKGPSGEKQCSCSKDYCNGEISAAKSVQLSKGFVMLVGAATLIAFGLM